MTNEAICEHGHLRRQCDICEANRERDDLRLENQRLRLAVCNQAGDNLCWLDDEQLGAIPPREEFLKSCERYHTQIAGERGEAGILAGCMTIAQLEAALLKAERGNIELKRERDELRFKLAYYQDNITVYPSVEEWLEKREANLKAEVVRTLVERDEARETLRQTLLGDTSDENLVKLRATVLHFTENVVKQDNDLRAQLAAMWRAARIHKRTR